MAGYRPKSLNELNEMYDKTITAEKAILKATKALEAETQTPSAVPESPAKVPEAENPSAVSSLSDEVDSLINDFELQQKKEPVPVKISAPEKITFEKAEAPEKPAPQPAQEITPEQKLVDEVFTPSKTNAVYDLATPEETQEKAFARSDERSELLEDYMKIMNDDDEDYPPSRESLSKKKKKRKMGLFFHSSSKVPTKTYESEPEDEYETESEPFDVPVVSFSHDIPLPHGFVNSHPSDEPDSEESASSFFSYDESESDEASDFSSGNETDNLAEPDYAPEAEQSVFEVELESKDENEIPVPRELENRTFEEYINESPDDIYSFDRTKENTLPSYAKSEYQPLEEEENYDEEDFSDEDDSFSAAQKSNGKKIFVSVSRVFLSIILVVLLLSSAFAVSVNSLFHTDTGILFGDDKYIFTADRDYVNADIAKNDLVITEKRYADTGESFAYVNYTEQCFMFGKMSGSIINDDGDVLFIAENNGERVLVLRDDTKGVVLRVYPLIGKAFRLCSENFIAVISVLLIASLIIILLLTLVLKNKDKAQQKMIKKMVKKGIIADEQTAEELIYEDGTSAEDEDLFSTIE